MTIRKGNKNKLIKEYTSTMTIRKGNKNKLLKEYTSTMTIRKGIKNKLLLFIFFTALNLTASCA